MAAAGDTVSKQVVLGRIVGAFGVAGWVKVESFTDPPGNILKYPLWQLSGRGQSLARKHLEGRLTAKGVQVRIEGIADRTEAEHWRGVEISVARSELPSLKPGEYYWEDLIGLQAIAPNGLVLGQIVEIRDTPAHPVLWIKGEPPTEGAAALEHWVPLVPKYLKSADIEGGTVTLDWYPEW